MCTIGYHRNLKLIFKNRDKASPTDEVVIVRPAFLAVKTEGADYYSVAINRYGCAFASAAVNTPRWTALVMSGKDKEARLQSQKENAGLVNPMIMLSRFLPQARGVDELARKLLDSGADFMGYNILLADSEKALHLEVHGRKSHLTVLTQDTVITNHFLTLEHGPRKSQDYPSSYKRMQSAKQQIKAAVSIEDIFQMLTAREDEHADGLWRSGVFSTVSSTVLDLESHALHYSTDPEKEFARVTGTTPAKGSERIFLEMSRYIDLPTYHNIERGHPYYVEMIDEIKAQIKARSKPPKASARKAEKVVRVLELGAGTGLCSLELVKFPFVKLDALDIDSECCKILSSHPELAGVNVIRGDASTYCKPQEYDMVISTFAHDHIHYNKRFLFAKNIFNNLKKGGVYIMGGEILPYFSNDLERKASLFRYHNFIIAEALTQGRVQLAELENNALKSGLDMVGDFKRHESMFEEEMRSAGFTLLEKKKMGPLEHHDRGGVFVYVYQA
ncbi:MAG TPA: methyltransferase domain-containing protein [Candidatus Omnitrophota bacterium]|nr:methyltransferase domain-containing protein [Candidatus Omnitrophota bacterium]HRZ15541.1 methyltransferase domain-containing protein [Candidatus Omnitrophota bacterium]